MTSSEQACREQLARLINTMPFVAAAAVTLTMKKRYAYRFGAALIANRGATEATMIRAAAERQIEIRMRPGGDGLTAYIVPACQQFRTASSAQS